MYYIIHLFAPFKRIELNIRTSKLDNTDLISSLCHLHYLISHHHKGILAMNKRELSRKTLQIFTSLLVVNVQ